MKTRRYRFFGGLIASQENWLNKMAAKGYRLILTAKAMYEFQQCRPGQYQYRVEFIGSKSKQSAEDYARFLEDCGYRVFFKNINLNYSIGKAQARPWAEKGGRIATNATTYNRELLLIEKENDGKDFELHTTFEDKRRYLKSKRKPWIYLLFISIALGFVTRQTAWLIFALIALNGLMLYQAELSKLKTNANVKEW